MDLSSDEDARTEEKTYAMHQDDILGAACKDIMTGKEEKEKLKTVEDNVMKLKYEIVGINKNMSSIAQASWVYIEKNTLTLSKASYEGIGSQDQRLRDFES